MAGKWYFTRDEQGYRTSKLQYVDHGKDYRGRLGAKDKARQARALTSANG